MKRAGLPARKSAALFCAVLLPISLGFAQTPGPAPAPLSPDQLNNLVAPIALYPDPLLSQVLAASTYPLEIVEAEQWVRQNGNLQGAQLVDAAKQQNWDPSIQALVAFPDALSLLSNDIRWTTALGDAFLGQQADVMNAVQVMRARAQANGRLATTPQQVVTTDTQDNQSAIEIQPADPQVVYVPVYNPAYVWGPPVWGAYPDLWYPDGFGFGFGFGPGIYISSFFPGWGGWGSWGWGCGWFGRSMYVNTGFFNRYGFRGGFRGGFAGGGFGGRGAWAHDPGHRMGVPYSNRAVASRFNSNRFTGSGGSGRQFSNVSRGSTVGAGANAGGWRRFNGDSRTATGGNPSFNRQASPNYSRGSAQSFRAPAQNYRGSNSAQSFRNQPSYNRSSNRSPAQAYSAPRGQSYSAPRFNASPSRSFSAPARSFASPSRSFSAPRSVSAPRSGGGSGFSGGRSSFGGGHSGGGGGHSGGGGHGGGRR